MKFDETGCSGALWHETELVGLNKIVKKRLSFDEKKFFENFANVGQERDRTKLIDSGRVGFSKRNNVSDFP